MTAKKAKRPDIPAGDEIFIQQILHHRHEIASALRQSTSRAQANEALADIFQATPATQLALLKTLARQPDGNAADVALAMNELAPQKEVRKEARRVLIQMAGRKIFPSWAPGSEQPTAIAASYPPRFWKGMVTLMRERGQAQLTLCWEQGFEYGEARMMSFLLDFWRDGVKDFYTEVGTRRHIEADYQEQIDLYEKNKEKEERVQLMDCTLAEGRRLLLEALDVNSWRKISPHKDYRYYLPTIQQLVLDAPDAGEDRGLTFINPELEPDEVVADFIGAWSLGDYGLCYDLLADDSAVREGLERDEWMSRRRDWADEAHPQRFEPRVIREREQSQGAIWLPGSYLSERGARREIDACWSLELADTPLSGTLPEMPLGTAVLRETGRHWFWTSYTLVQQEGSWRIQRIRDEGANIQGLTLDELEKRLQEQKDAIQGILEHQDPQGPDAQRFFEEIVWRTNYSLYYLDALLIKNPLDFQFYEEAVRSAGDIGLRERSVVYLEKWAAHFPHHPDYIRILHQLGSVESLLAGDYRAAGLEQRSRRFFELGEQALQEALEVRREALTYLLLGELKVTQGDLDMAENYFRQGLEADPSREEEALLENDLAGIYMDREQPEEALRHYRRVEEIDANFRNLAFNIGYAYRKLEKASEAEQYLKRSIEEEPDYVPAYIELATLYASTHDYEQAIRFAKEAMRLQPDSGYLHGLLASVYLQQGDGRRTEIELKEAERLDPDQPLVKTVRRIFNEARRR